MGKNTEAQGPKWFFINPPFALFLASSLLNCQIRQLLITACLHISFLLSHCPFLNFMVSMVSRKNISHKNKKKLGLIEAFLFFLCLYIFSFRSRLLFHWFLVEPNNAIILKKREIFAWDVWFKHCLKYTHQVMILSCNPSRVSLEDVLSKLFSDIPLNKQQMHCFYSLCKEPVSQLSPFSPAREKKYHMTDNSVQTNQYTSISTMLKSNLNVCSVTSFYFSANPHGDHYCGFFAQLELWNQWGRILYACTYHWPSLHSRHVLHS